MASSLEVAYYLLLVDNLVVGHMVLAGITTAVVDIVAIGFTTVD